MRSNGDIDAVYAVAAGKFRRYHGEGLRQILDVKTVGLNTRDMFRTVKGFFQSYRLLKKIKPDCIFVKGGFVGVPVGLAAARLRIPFITHDSDAIPGLANRIIARWAVLHTVALPAEVYSYPKSKTLTVGVPVHANYQPIGKADRDTFRQEIGLGAYAKMLFITGGGLGAQRLNTAVEGILPKLLENYPDLAVVQSVGRKNEVAINQRYGELLTPEHKSRVVVEGYMTDMHRYSGAANIIITRAGATALAEFAIQQKACVVVPNPQLTAGHQLKNAEYLAVNGAVAIVREDKLVADLYPTLVDLLDSEEKQVELGKKMAKFAVPDAAQRLAMVLLEQATR